jgi:hypothetical protein
MARRRSDASGCVMVFVYILAFEIICAAVAVLACYAVCVAIVGGAWAGIEAYRRNKGRPYVDPKQRFMAVWSHAVSPVDPKRWVTPQQRPATDPHLLPGQVTGWLRVEDEGIRRVDEPGPFEQFVIHMRLSNHGPRPVDFAGGDEVDVQLWDINGNVVGSDIAWDHPGPLPPNSHIATAVRVRLIDHHPVESWAIGHRGEQATYVFFPVLDRRDTAA